MHHALCNRPVLLVFIVAIAWWASTALGHTKPEVLAACAGFKGASMESLSIARTGSEFLDGLFSVTDIASHPWIRRAVLVAGDACTRLNDLQDFNTVVSAAGVTLGPSEYAPYVEFVFNQFMCPESWCVTHVEVVFANQSEFAGIVTYDADPLTSNTEILILGVDGQVLWRRSEPASVDDTLQPKPQSGPYLSEGDVR